MANPKSNGDVAIDLGSRLNLMVNDYLVDRFEGKAELRLHRPVEREVVFACDRPCSWPACRISLTWLSIDQALKRRFTVIIDFGIQTPRISQALSSDDAFTVAFTIADIPARTVSGRMAHEMVSIAKSGYLLINSGKLNGKSLGRRFLSALRVRALRIPSGSLKTAVRETDDRRAKATHREAS